MLAIACFATYTSETFLASIVGDDRLLRHATEYREGIREEIHYLVALPMYVWSRMAALVSPDCTAVGLRESVLESSYRSAAYIFKEVFAVIEQYPLRLCQGDITANLQALRTFSGNLDETSTKIQYLLEFGWPLESIVAGVELWREMPCSTDLVEQAHGSGASLMMHHKFYVERTLRSRSVVHQCRFLIQPSAFEKQLASLQSRLEKEMARRPAQASAFHAFYKASCTAIAEALGLSEQPSAASQRQVLSRCHIEFEALPRENKLHWQRVSQSRIHSQLQEQQASCDHVRDQIQLVRAREEQWVQKFGVENHLSICRFTVEEMHGLLEQFNSITAATWESLLHGPLLAPGVPSEEQQAALIDVAERYHIKSPQPWWVRHFVWNRELFRGTAVCLVDRDPDVAWMLVLALQKPSCAVLFAW